MIILYLKNRRQTAKVGSSFSKLLIIIYGIPRVSNFGPQCFMKNNLKANAGKFHLFLSPYENQTITIENYVIKPSSVEKRLGVTIDSN